MSVVSQLVIAIESPPRLPEVAGVTVRNLNDSSDIGRFVLLRNEAFAAESPPVAPWRDVDFRREIASKPWWRPERLWLAETMHKGAIEVIGGVVLAQRGEGRPAVHWLAVAPHWRRRGVGRLLIAQLQRYCWDHGWRRIYLETHRGWSAAAAFYRRLGFVECQT